MSILFEQTQINGMSLSNRFVRSATWEGMAADDGSVTGKLIDTMVGLAEGGVGLIITGHAYIRPEGQAGQWQLGVYKDEQVNGLKEMVTAVHNSGGKIIMQLAHSGNMAREALTGHPAMVVSDFEGLSSSPRREMTKKDIEELISAFGEATRRAKEAGFDGVQIHSAHGYLLNQFLSPLTNRRTDEYGGDIEGRSRIHLEVYKTIRAVAGGDYPVLIKINGRDFLENGLELEDSIIAAKRLANAGLDAIELSGGQFSSGKLGPCRAGIGTAEQEAYFRKEARVFKKEIEIPLILVGGMRSFEVAEELVEGGVTDYISLSRPFIREPDLIRRWKNGDRRRALCKSDNMCFKPAMKGHGIYCVTKEREKEEMES